MQRMHEDHRKVKCFVIKGVSTTDWRRSTACCAKLVRDRFRGSDTPSSYRYTQRSQSTAIQGMVSNIPT